jgi:hypothetical protein
MGTFRGDPLFLLIAIACGGLMGLLVGNVIWGLW